MVVIQYLIVISFEQDMLPSMQMGSKNGYELNVVLVYIKYQTTVHFLSPNQASNLSLLLIVYLPFEGGDHYFSSSRFF